MWLIHSAKGQTWKNHKYIRKEGNRYIYKEKDSISVNSNGILSNPNHIPGNYAAQDYIRVGKGLGKQAKKAAKGAVKVANYVGGKFSNKSGKDRTYDILHLIGGHSMAETYIAVKNVTDYVKNPPPKEKEEKRRSHNSLPE